MAHFRFVLASLFTTTLATAAPLPGATHSPPRFVDEADLFASLFNPSGGDAIGYRFRIFAHVFGVADGDAVRIDWTQKGKTVAQQRCKLDRDGDEALMKCDYEGKLLTATGDIVANLIYLDDQDGKEYLLRAMKIKVGTFYWMKRKSFQVVGDDLLGSAVAWHQTTTDEFHRGEHEMRFYLWGAKTADTVTAKLRCSIDGKRQPDLAFTMTAHAGNIQMPDDSSGKDVRYHWSQFEGYAYNLLFGTRAEAEAARHTPTKPEDVVLGDHPGAWECEIRADGATIRTMKFTVDKGRIVSSLAQTGARLLSSEVLIELGLPKPAWDDRIRPDAIRASHRYGLAWPSDPAIAAHLKALPAATGYPDPGSGPKK
ncbi:MAG: hypothetical protein ABI867_35665 [Kofleriaceae bacterium]